MKNTKLLQNRDLLTKMMGSSTLPEIFFNRTRGKYRVYSANTHPCLTCLKGKTKLVFEICCCCNDRMTNKLTGERSLPPMTSQIAKLLLHSTSPLTPGLLSF